MIVFGTYISCMMIHFKFFCCIKELRTPWKDHSLMESPDDRG